MAAEVEIAGRARVEEEKGLGEGMANDSVRSLQVMAHAARKAGRIIRRHYQSESLNVKKKSVQGDLVSVADLEAELEILAILKGAFRHASIVAEESGGSYSTGTTFYVDPLDGTLNFVHGVPLFAVSIGCWIDSVPASGVVLNPLSGDLYTAVRGSGARKNGKPIAVSEASVLRDSLITTGWPYDPSNRTRIFSEMDRVYIGSQALRALGCASLGFCLVADGAFDGYWEWGLKPWDMAAGALIVQEAGGTVSSLSGGGFDLNSAGVAASNGRIHTELVDTLCK
jgi:myo-inositol-1(or 4)-monophosphatase